MVEDICDKCKNLIVIEARFRKERDLFTYKQCKYKVGSLFVEKCSHFKAKPKGYKDEYNVSEKALDKKGQIIEELGIVNPDMGGQQ